MQVVRNSGWLIPYVACSITALGMLVHFFGTLQRFLSRREREIAKQEIIRQPAGPVIASVAIYALIALGMLQPWTATSYGIASLTGQAVQESAAQETEPEATEDETGTDEEDEESDEQKDTDKSKADGKSKDSDVEFDFAQAGAIPRSVWRPHHAAGCLRSSNT